MNQTTPTNWSQEHKQKASKKADDQKLSTNTDKEVPEILQNTVIMPISCSYFLTLQKVNSKIIDCDQYEASLGCLKFFLSFVFRRKVCNWFDRKKPKNAI